MNMKIINALKSVFTRPTYILIAVFSAFLIFAFANLLPNLSFARYIIGGDLDLGYKIKILWGMLGYFKNNSGLASQIMIVSVAVLAGMDIAMAIFYAKRKIVSDRAAGFGMLGIVGGFFGIGCGACGSVVLSSIVGVGASGQLVGILPLKGLEFSVLSLGILIASILYLAKKIQDPMVCRINK